MFRPHTLAYSVLSAFAVSGCALLPQHKSDPALEVRPSYAVEHGGVKPEQMYRIGRALQGQGRYDAAIAAYRETLAHAPMHADAYNGLGVAYAAQGRYDAAIVAFRSAIALTPAAAHLHNNLGYVWLLRGNDDEAAKALAEALRLEPDNDKAAHNLRRLMQRMVTPKPLSPAAGLPQPSAGAASPGASLPEAAAGDALPPTSNLVVAPNLTINAVAPHVYELQPLSAAPRAVVPVQAAGESPEPARKLEPVPAKPYKLEVSNGNGIGNFARRVADYLDAKGIATGRLTNAATFNESTTVIEYRQGYLAEALAVGKALPKAVPAVASETLRSDVDLRIVLGRDLREDVAMFAPPPRAQLLADAQPQLSR